MSNIIALIPSRSSSKRVPGKNIRILNHHPLLAYSIAAAQSSGIFSGIYCSSDSDEILAIAHYYGASPIKRPADYATDTSPDADWIRHALGKLYLQGTDPKYFMILRPTSPFRTAVTIQSAWRTYIDSPLKGWMKAVEPVKQHPLKMWEAADGRPYMKSYNPEHKLHALPLQALGPLYVQNGCIEIRPRDEIEPSIYQPFFTDGYCGLDINQESDWVYAEWLIRQGKATLPEVNRMPYQHRNLMEEMYGD